MRRHSHWCPATARRSASGWLAVALLTLGLSACGTGANAPGDVAAEAAPQQQAASATAPCVQPVEACRHWIIYGDGPARSMVYASYPLDQYNPNIKRALIMVHGAVRNVGDYFRTATAAAFLDGALDDTLVVAPHLINNTDPRQPNEVVWPESEQDPVNWRDGGVSLTNPGLTSFDFVDQIVLRLADKRVFPNLAHIVIAGHSAGGQFTNRYEMSNKLDGKLEGVSMSYAVANPSTYAWPTAERPLPVGDADPNDAYKEAMNGTKAGTDFKYGKIDASGIPDYNKWPMGMDDLAGYTGDMTADQLRKQLAERKTTYLLGQVDVLPLGGFNDSPVAMAQGPTRRARGEAYAKYVRDKLGADHKIIIVSECAHDNRCMFTSDEVLPVLFPE